MSKDSKKKLMFQVSATLSQVEAIDFVRTLNPNEKYWLVRTGKKNYLDRFVIVRDLRPGEVPIGSWGRRVDKGELISLGNWKGRGKRFS